MNDYEQHDDQYEILQIAVKEGYFKVPRETTLVELSEQLDTTDVETSKRLRRALDSYLREELLSEES